MKTFNHILLLGSLAFGGAAMAGVPVKAPLSRYQALWQSSLFTTRLTCGIPAEPPTICNDLTLGGVSPIPGGYRVTVFSKGTHPQRMTFDSTSPRADLLIDKVEFNAADPLETIVHVSSGGRSGQLRFDRKFLASRPQNASHPTTR